MNCTSICIDSEKASAHDGLRYFFFFFNDTATTEIYTLSLHDALPISPPNGSALAALEDGSAHVVQSALSQGFTSLNKGETPAAVHFAQVNEMDGFFLTGREADPAFTWDKLEGTEVVMFKGGQPATMFKYA